LAPIRSLDVLPPLGQVAAAIETGRLNEQHRAWRKKVPGHGRMRLWIDASLSKRLEASSIDEFRELCVGYLMLIDPETVDLDRMTELFLRPFLVRSHDEAAARDKDHSGMVALASGDA